MRIPTKQKWKNYREENKNTKKILMLYLWTFPRVGFDDFSLKLVCIYKSLCSIDLVIILCLRYCLFLFLSFQLFKIFGFILCFVVDLLPTLFLRCCVFYSLIPLFIFFLILLLRKLGLLLIISLTLINASIRHCY